MKSKNKLLIGLSAFLMAGFFLGGIACALDFSIEPATAQRTLNNPVRVQIYATDADAIISMGFKVIFDPAVLQAQATTINITNKNVDFTNGFVMDADGNDTTTDDQYTTPVVEIDNTAGTVTMLGGRLIGDSTDGLNGKVLLGWIDFNTIATGTSDLMVDLARDSEKFVHFAGLPSGESQDPSRDGLPVNLGWIYVGDDACEADLDSSFAVDAIDADLFRTNFADPTGCLVAGRLCVADMNGDGTVDAIDADLFRGDFGLNAFDRPCPQP